MSRMNKRSKKWQMFIARAMAHLPRPVALFIMDRLLAPLVLMCAAVFATAWMIVAMAMVFVVAPLSPKGAREFWDIVMKGFISE